MVMMGKLPEGSPIVAVISGNLNLGKMRGRMSFSDSGALAGLSAAFLGARPAARFVAT
jgi:hypothetical protein